MKRFILILLAFLGSAYLVCEIGEKDKNSTVKEVALAEILKAQNNVNNQLNRHGFAEDKLIRKLEAHISAFEAILEYEDLGLYSDMLNELRGFIKELRNNQRKIIENEKEFAKELSKFQRLKLKLRHAV